MTTVIICSGGPKQDLPPLEKYHRSNDVIYIGADKGSIYLLEQGIIPDEIVGDFDSLSNEEWLKVTNLVNKIERVQAEKDDTDTDLALEKALLYKPTEIILTGVTGGRLDHFESALRSMYRVQSKNLHIRMKILNDKNEIQFLFPGKYPLHPDDRFQYLSFFAYEQNVKDVTLRGVKYETTNELIELGTSRFTSNELNSIEGYISFSSGICLVIRSSD
ncbi:thiamine diphosphokinase [Ureibacillus manganicus]|uniref:Thiamine diphosphokinase n=1 Tax=Ureibacillus manganicus DSM 26584 TaxID=1384049 RepID=A0A0A3I6R4_9BACL|nr:thiamine diphosphokinase [Ureibacillus manganicus]KGR80399.1 thiamine pyrophosphokinase [Ureibacillus manganicus DSM 26584]